MNDERDTLSDTMQIIGAGLVAAVIAGGLAVLLATKASRELRDELKGPTGEAAEKVGRATHILAHRLREKAAEIRGKATAAAKQAMQQLEEQPRGQAPEDIGV